MLQGFWTIYTEPYRKYGTLTGRARRREFWVFVLVNMVISFILSLIDVRLGWYSTNLNIGALEALFGVPLIIPGVTVTVRRLHDSGLSGWWFWIPLIPILGALISLVQLLRRGTRGENRFGPDPLGDIIIEIPADGGPPFATARGRFFVCPSCLRTNPAGRDSCQWCHRPYREQSEDFPEPFPA